MNNPAAAAITMTTNKPVLVVPPSESVDAGAVVVGARVDDGRGRVALTTSVVVGGDCARAAGAGTRTKSKAISAASTADRRMRKRGRGTPQIMGNSAPTPYGVRLPDVDLV